jgi:hypothetical protein
MSAPIADTIRSKIGKFSNADTNWVIFVKDHIYQIIESSTKITVKPEDMHLARYRPEEFLVDNGLPKELWWVLLFMNQISAHKDFVALTTVLLPSLNYMLTLYDKYKIQATTESGLTTVTLFG